MKKLLFVILLLSITISSAQKKERNATDEEHINELKQKPLVLVLRKGKSESIKQFNSSFKDAVESEWTEHTTFKIITEDELKEHKKNKIDTYAYLKYDKISTGKAIDNSTTKYKVIRYFKLKGKKEYGLYEFIRFKEKDHKARFYELIQNINNTFINPSHILSMNYTRGSSKEDVQNRALNLANTAKEELKDKTLLINQDLLDKEINDEIIKKYYPYSFKIVSENEIDEAIVNNDKTKAILLKSEIIDVDTGKLIFHFYFNYDDLTNGTKIAPYGIGLLGRKIKVENLQNLGSFFRK